MALWTLSGTTWVSRYLKGKTKTNLDLLEQKIVSGSGISWAICKSAPWPRHITITASDHSVFYRYDTLLHQSTEGKTQKSLILSYPNPSRILLRSLASKNYSLCTIILHCLHDLMFSRFDMTLARNGYTRERGTHTHTHMTAHTTLAEHRMVKIHAVLQITQLLIIPGWE